MGSIRGKKTAAAALALATAVTPLTAYGQEAAAVQQAGQQQDSQQIIEAIARGLMSKDKQGAFHAERTLTRAEFAALLVRTFGLSTSAAESSTFKDVRKENWASPYIEAVNAKGWMKGSGNSFQPNEPVTREQAAAVLVRALGIDTTVAAEATAPSDLSAAGKWAQTSVQAAVTAELLPLTDGKFNPQVKLTRGEAASVIVTVSNRLPLTIEHVEAGKVTASGITYSAAADVQGLFTAANQAALTGAKLTAVIRDGVIESVQALELLASGKPAADGAAEFSGNVVLDGQGAVIAGSLTVNADYISLNDITVKGTFEVGAGLNHDFYSTGLKVEGETVINGGDDNTVVFKDANLGPVSVNKQEVRVEAKGTSKVGEITVNSSANIQADSGIQLPKVTIGNGVSEVTLDAEVKDLNVSSGGSKLTLGSNAKIDNLVLPDGVKSSSVIKNYDEVKNNISKQNGSSNPPSTSTGTTSSSGSSSSGSSSGSTTPAAVSKTALQSKINAANAVLEAVYMENEIGDDYGQYSSAAIDTLMLAIGFAQQTYTLSTVTQSAVDQAVQALDTAITAFQNAKRSTVNMSALANLVAFAGIQDMSSFNQDYIDEVDQAIAKAKVVLTKDLAGAEGQDEVNAAINELNLTIDLIYQHLNLIDLLRTTINQSKSDLASMSAYREEDADNLQMALDKAAIDLNTAGISSSELGISNENLQYYASTFRLSGLLYNVQTILSSTKVGTDVGDALREIDLLTLQDAFEAAESILIKVDVTRMELDSATNSLSSAVTVWNNVKIGDKTALKNLTLSIDATLQSADMTTQAAIDLKKANDEAKAFIDGPPATVSAINAANNTLVGAQISYAKSNSNQSIIPGVSSELSTYNETTDTFDINTP